MTRKIHDSSGIRDATSEELAEINAREKEWSDNSSNRKLELIKEYRLEKLLETDWWVLRGNMSEAQSTYRQNLRNIPQDYSEEQYDELLARDEQDNLTHSVWSKP
tara:strand:- start:25 stop:339 length:315 start_codon:yes stop_codon:yes gene_type:complete